MPSFDEKKMIRNHQNNKIITNIDIIMALKNSYAHLVPQLGHL